jgi:hypothetical protein
MALWTYQIDSLDINDGVNFTVVAVPEIDNLPPTDIILVERAGDTPEYVREQPVEQVYTAEIFVEGVGETTWYARMQSLKAVLLPGLHTFKVQARGWPAAATVQVVKRNMSTNYKLRGVTLELVAPNPVWTPA